MNEENFKQTISKAFGSDVWQCEYFPLVDRWQVVITIEQSRTVLLEKLRQILIIAKLNARKSVRVAFKLKSGLTVASMIYDKQVVEDYADSDDLQQIAQEFDIASGLK